MNIEINSSEYCCRVCGYEYQEPIWRDAESPSYEICICCGVQFGYEDTDLEGVREYRNNWIDDGAKWFSSHHRYKLSSWDMESQLKQLPKQWQ